MRITCLLGALMVALPSPPASGAAHASAATDVAASHDAVVLRGDGVATPNARIGFGLDQSRVLDRLSAAFGAAPSQRDELSDCGSGADAIASWDNGFAAYFDDDRFVGWMAVDQRTAEGIGFGSSRAELDAAYDPEVAESSLGLEFNVDGLSGVLESESADAAISAFWAGDACVMR